MMLKQRIASVTGVDEHFATKNGEPIGTYKVKARRYAPRELFVMLRPFAPLF